MPLSIRREARPASHAVILVAAGELDLAAVDEMDAAVDAAVASEPTHLVFELTGLTFCDSTGLSLFVRAHKRMVERGGRLSLVGVRPPVLKVIKLTGLDALLRLHTDVDMALAD
jgi:anti-sigma B factor antagonist